MRLKLAQTEALAQSLAFLRICMGSAARWDLRDAIVPSQEVSAVAPRTARVAAAILGTVAFAIGRADKDGTESAVTPSRTFGRPTRAWFLHPGSNRA